MIKVTNKAAPTPPAGAEYPRLKYGVSNTIVLFTNKECGTVISAGNGSLYSVGDYHDDWIDAHFVDYHGTVTLENEQ